MQNKPQLIAMLIIGAIMILAFFVEIKEPNSDIIKNGLAGLIGFIGGVPVGASILKNKSGD